MKELKKVIELLDKAADKFEIDHPLRKQIILERQRIEEILVNIGGDFV